MHLSIDQFNTEIFGICMANLTEIEENVTDEDIKKYINYAKNVSINTIIAKVDTRNKAATNCFLQNGFYLADTQVMYKISVTNFMGLKSVNGFSTRRFIESDKNLIMKIAKEAFKIDQFHSDPMLSSEKSDCYYEQWARNSCNGFADFVYVLIENSTNRVAGFITLKRNDYSVTVGLAAIARLYYGNGLLSFMLSETIKKIRKYNIETLYYGTQLSNIPVLKTMVKFDAIPLYSKYVMHKMI